MKTELRLGSVVAHGVGGAEAGSMDLIYLFLLSEFGQNAYRRIGINQIGNDLNEFVAKEPGNKIHVNIRYPAYEDFESKSIADKNLIRLDIIHSALLRVADYDKKLDVEKLEEIKTVILKNDFSFDFTYKSCTNKRNPDLIGKIIVHPSIDKIVFYAVIEVDGNTQCKLNIFNGITEYSYMSKYFCYSKWKGENEFIIWGKEHTVETHILIKRCVANVVNLTSYENPPYYTLMKAALPEEERRKARKDWEHSLPPAVAAIIRDADN
jgi:hypothetical protein